MLVLTRKVGSRIIIDNDIIVTVADVKAITCALRLTLLKTSAFIAAKSMMPLSPKTNSLPCQPGRSI